MKIIKGFDKNMVCDGNGHPKQYKEGVTYTEDKADLCNTGFHGCENPIDCLNYYAPNNSVYHVCELEGVTNQKEDDSKRVGNKITIGAEIKILDIIKLTFDYVKEHCTNNESGEDNACLNGGDRSALNGGDRSALNGGYKSALNGGYRSALNGGYMSALNGGYMSALNGGDMSALNGGYKSALNGGNDSALNGGYKSALNGGDDSALNGGDWSALNGGNMSVIYGGEDSKVKGGLHSVLAIQYWKNGEFVRIAFAEVDDKNIKADTWYKLDDNGEFIPCEE